MSQGRLGNPGGIRGKSQYERGLENPWYTVCGEVRNSHAPRDDRRMSFHVAEVQTADCGEGSSCWIIQRQEGAFSQSGMSPMHVDALTELRKCYVCVSWGNCWQGKNGKTKSGNGSKGCETDKSWGPTLRLSSRSQRSWTRRGRRAEQLERDQSEWSPPPTEQLQPSISDAWTAGGFARPQRIGNDREL